MIYPLIRALLFTLPPEVAHHLTLNLLDQLPAACFKKPTGKPVQVMGISFPHQIGLAAGLDKNGSHLNGLAKLGFAFLEIGSVTPLPQVGNPKPRLFRLTKAKALINRMGFNNEGLAVLVNNVLASGYKGILGINLGKNKETPLESAVNDYCIGLNQVYALASYITINISSPNTPGLRVLQQENYLKQLVKILKEEQQRLADKEGRWVPLVIKLSPDEDDEALKRIAHDLVKAKIEGIIATNTTANHHAVADLKYGKEIGGLSGKPLFARSTACLRLIKSIVGQDVALIAAGGIDSFETAREKLKAGASLLQIYTGLIYQGPKLIRDLNL